MDELNIITAVINDQKGVIDEVEQLVISDEGLTRSEREEKGKDNKKTRKSASKHDLASIRKVESTVERLKFNAGSEYTKVPSYPTFL